MWQALRWNGWGKETDRMEKILASIGRVVLAILKCVVWMALGAMKLLFALVRVALILFGLVAGVFLAFMRMGAA